LRLASDAILDVYQIKGSNFITTEKEKDKKV